MKSPQTYTKGRRAGQLLSWGLGLAAVLSFASSATAAVLLDGNSVLIIDPTSAAGANTWAVDSQDQLFKQWFWYREGDVGEGTREYSISTLSAPTVTGSGNSATIAYSGSLFDISITYLLAGGAGGSGQSTLNEDILIVNKTAALLDLQFFQYSDFDLAGTKEGDTALLYPSTSPYELAYQWDGNVGLTEGIISVNPFASRGDVGFAPTIVNLLEDNSVTDLYTSTSTVGPGDVEFAFQWDLAIEAGGAVTISKVKDLNVYIIPEPAVTALSLMGLAFVAVRRLRRR